MGPHSFKCGKNEKQYVAGRIGRGFNGAALFQVRKVGNTYEWPAWTFRLQWGRTLSSAERSGKKRPDPHGKPASMGPHSFKCGKVWLAG